MKSSMSLNVHNLTQSSSTRYDGEVWLVVDEVWLVKTFIHKDCILGSHTLRSLQPVESVK